MRFARILFILLFPLMGWGQLQGSGPISMSDIRNETGTLSGPYSLTDGVGDYGVSAPVSFSDFYGLSYTTCDSSQVVGGVGGGNLYYSTSQPLDCLVDMEDYGANIYGSNTSFAFTLGLYTTNGGCTPAPSGYYSNGLVWKYWDSATETFTNTGNC